MPDNHQTDRRTMAVGHITIDSGEDRELSSVMRRVGAELIDSVLLVLGGLLIGILATTTSAIVALIALILFLCLMMYEITAHAVWGQTIGKAALGIEVIRMDGQSPPGWSKSFGRWAVLHLPLAIPGVGFVYLVVWFIALVSHEHRRGWHDRAAGTVVVCKKPGPARKRREVGDEILGLGMGPRWNR